MLFNSIEFLVFLPIVFILYWYVTDRNLKLQNFLLLVASYIFYGWWSYIFLTFIAFTTILDYTLGLQLHKSQSQARRKLFLWLSMGTNLGLLGFFKYYNFFVDSWVDAWASVGYEMDIHTARIILPVGISFYTFQTMSYCIDIYRRQLEPTKDLLAFAVYISFFPQLVAGPIERATNLLPQVLKKRTFDYANSIKGLKLILWGMFKKVAIADSIGITVDQIFNNYEAYNGATLLLGAVLFAFQIYTDFSGYSDIAVGLSKVFGFELMSNFKYPYFSRDIAEFWRRWHISLSTWFRDYVYIPLGGSKVKRWKAIRNTFIIFLLSGFWHGANYTFIIWGAIHAMLFIPLLLLKRNRRHVSNIVAADSPLPSFKELLQMVSTFAVVTLAWVFFRANSLHHALDYLSEIFKPDLFQTPQFLSLLFFPLVLLLFEWAMRHNERDLFLFIKNKFVRYSVYYIMLVWCLVKILLVKDASFIYFQF